MNLRMERYTNNELSSLIVRVCAYVPEIVSKIILDHDVLKPPPNRLHSIWTRRVFIVNPHKVNHHGPNIIDIDLKASWATLIGPIRSCTSRGPDDDVPRRQIILTYTKVSEFRHQSEEWGECRFTKSFTEIISDDLLPVPVLREVLKVFPRDELYVYRPSISFGDRCRIKAKTLGNRNSLKRLKHLIHLIRDGPTGEMERIDCLVLIFEV
ncbi:hypothetical protein IW262DRAFT_1339163 [Armillaria fumosa]|nr:hypothetical protein IW262DRAFT_1339163 [Armillaria fumosa]